MSKLWKDLHERAISHTGSEDKLFLRTWAAKLPRFTTGCACNEFWKKWSTLNKPVHEPEGFYFAWTIKAHNAVNAKLKKKQWTIEEALREWAPKNVTFSNQRLQELNQYLKKPSTQLSRRTMAPYRPSGPAKPLGQVGIQQKSTRTKPFMPRQPTRTKPVISRQPTRTKPVISRQSVMNKPVISKQPTKPVEPKKFVQKPVTPKRFVAPKRFVQKPVAVSGNKLPNQVRPLKDVQRNGRYRPYIQKNLWLPPKK